VLRDASVHATLPTSDVDALRPFYEDTLGLTPHAVRPAAVMYQLPDGTRFVLSRSGARASGAHTQLAFNVADVTAEVAALQAKGVVFEANETPKTIGGIAQLPAGRGAWFKDPAGNLLGIFQFDDPV